MTREKINDANDDDINTMRILFNALIGDLCNQCRHNDAEEMEGIRDKLIKRLLEKNKVYEWISVDERLPEDGEEVLCFLESEEMAVLFRRNNWGQYEWVDGDFATGSYDVIAWMQLPQPYKSESEVQE